MLELLLAALVFIGTHLGISGTPLRGILVAKVGEGPYLIGYAVISLVTISWLSDAYKAAPYVETWGQLYALQSVALVLMFVAFFLVVVGLTTPSPTLVGAEALLDKEKSVTGILRITRHPFLSGVALWGLTHLVVNGDLAGLILFGSLVLLCVIGAYSIDAKRREKLGDKWSDFAARTSVLPFGAIIQGRNWLSVAELGWWRILLAVVGFSAMLHFHGQLFGVSPIGALLRG
ncbi:MAG: NnrU family protein [Gammaproteobacteria bacterium]